MYTTAEYKMRAFVSLIFGACLLYAGVQLFTTNGAVSDLLFDGALLASAAILLYFALLNVWRMRLSAENESSQSPMDEPATAVAMTPRPKRVDRRKNPSDFFPNNRRFNLEPAKPWLYRDSATYRSSSTDSTGR